MSVKLGAPANPLCLPVAGQYLALGLFTQTGAPLAIRSKGSCHLVLADPGVLLQLGVRNMSGQHIAVWATLRAKAASPNPLRVNFNRRGPGQRLLLAPRQYRVASQTVGGSAVMPLVPGEQVLGLVEVYLSPENTASVAVERFPLLCDPGCR